MVIRDRWRMTDSAQPDVDGLLREILQQQTAMLQVQAESVRLQRVLVERLLGVSNQTTAPVAVVPPTSSALERQPSAAPAEAAYDPPLAPSPADQNLSRGARYYVTPPSPGARRIAPEDLELMRRLQEMREASDLIVQFGPHKGSTLAQVAMSNPEYIRELMTRAQRPEVRAAAGRLVQALDAAGRLKSTCRKERACLTRR
jgi:hypothetical protein